MKDLPFVMMGFFGGATSLLTAPHVILSSGWGACMIAAAVAFSSKIGANFGGIIWKQIVIKYQKFKNKHL